MAYIWKDEYKGRYSIKKRPGKYKRRQQGCSDVQRRIMDKKNNSRNNNVKKKLLWQPLITMTNDSTSE